jgi:hypothetical protein
LALRLFDRQNRRMSTLFLKRVALNAPDTPLAGGPERLADEWKMVPLAFD